MDARLSIYTHGHVPRSVTCRATSPAGAIPQQEAARLNRGAGGSAASSAHCSPVHRLRSYSARRHACPQPALCLRPLLPDPRHLLWCQRHIGAWL